jgi:hypothetical protein
VDGTDWKLLHDVFPCEVVLPDNTVARRCRAFIFDDGVVIYSGGEQGAEPTRLFAARHREEPDLPRRGTSRLRWRATVRSTEGTLQINRTGGCGCHSRLTQLIPADVRG